MVDHTENTSSNVILVLCASLLAIVGGGWFLLDTDLDATPSVGLRPTVTTSEIPATSADPDNESLTADVADPPTDEALTDATEAGADEVELDTESDGDAMDAETYDAPVPAAATIDSDLRKARLAAEAEILTDPANQSALFYYGRVLGAEPGHEVANAELNEVLGRLAMTATDLLANGQYDEALELADKVSVVRADHALVNQVQQTLNQLSGDLVTRAMQQAESGDDDAAAEALAEAEALPGRNAEYFQAVRASVDDLLQEKADERAELVETERASAARQTADWMASVRGAIAAGNLIEPDGESALAALAERDVDDEIAGQLRDELLSAILASASTNVFEGNLDRASDLAAAAQGINPDSENVTQFLSALTQAYVTQESARVLPVTELNRLTNVPANYPRRAEERGISGWVEVLFTVSTGGRTEDITVVGAEPDNVFDSSAIKAVEQWTFQPRMYRGEAIPQRATARLVFRLQGE